MRWIFRIVLTGFLILYGFQATAGYQAGLNAFSVGDYDTAMDEWRAVADGPPDAVVPTVYAETHFAIATLYWRGLGVRQDYGLARDWLLKAAELGHANAQAKLGFMYTDGMGVRQDYLKAFEWFEKAAAGGSVDGLYNLGIYYLYGWGVAADRTMAKQYLAAASALGDTASEDALQQLLAEEAAGHLGFDTEEPEEVIETEHTSELASRAAEPRNSAFSVRDEAWILAQDPAHYTIQVMALSSTARLLEQIDGFEDLAPFAIYRLENDGRPLFVLVQGVYEDVESARAARDVFPRRVQQPSQLWIRRFEKVQRLIRVEELE